MSEKMDDLKNALKKQTEKANLARESKAKLSSLEEKLERATAAMKEPVARKAATQASSPFLAEHTVVSGDTLSGIAKKYYGKADWKAIYEANKEAIGDNPNVIHVGQVFKIPKLDK